MAVSGGKNSSEGEPAPSAAATPVDSASLDPISLAQAVLARKVRPRAADVRRLAEALLEIARQPAKKKKKKGDKKAEKKAGKKRKLSKIPGQQDSQ